MTLPEAASRTDEGMLHAPVVRFLVAGGANAALTYLLFRALLRGFAALPHPVAIAQATTYAVGVAISFVTNRYWAFQSNGAANRELPRFLLAHSGALALSTVLMQVGVVRVGLPIPVCFVLVTGANAVVNFTAQRYWVFARR